MEEHFYIYYIVLYAIFFALAFFLLKHLFGEFTSYRLFSKNGNMRALMAKDPRRFHISLVYLMAYMTRSDGNAIRLDKLALIVKYIREVCPKECQEDAMKTLKFLTDRKKDGEDKVTESIVDVDAFMRGSDNCIKTGDNSSRYAHDLHGVRLAEELALYMTEEDRLYVMYLLYRLAIADGKITAKGKYSEVNMLHRLCVKGLKIEKEKLEDLLSAFSKGNDSAWYEQQFSDKDSRYPSSDAIANIFRKDSDSITLLDKQVSRKSFLGSTLCVILLSSLIILILAVGFICEDYDNMADIYPEGTFLIVIVLSIATPCLAALSRKELESFLVPIVRTKIEDALQLKSLIVGSILSFVVLAVFFFCISYLLFLQANLSFCNEEPIVVTVPVKEAFSRTGGTKSRNTYYYVSFPTVSLSDRKFDMDQRRQVSTPNSICLKTLPVMSGIKFIEIKNTKTKDEIEVSDSDYCSATGRNIKLYFRMGYYGIIYLEKYQLE